MPDQEQIAFTIISSVGSATSSYIEAIRRAKAGDFEGAERLMNKGTESFLTGHKAHAKLLTQEAGGSDSPMTLLLVHAEDQLMNASAFKTLAQEFIDVYQKMEALESGSSVRAI